MQIVDDTGGRQMRGLNDKQARGPTLQPNQKLERDLQKQKRRLETFEFLGPYGDIGY